MENAASISHVAIKSRIVADQVSTVRKGLMVHKHKRGWRSACLKANALQSSVEWMESAKHRGVLDEGLLQCLRPILFSKSP